jgi:glycosyltransferase involved in cell wall biosynthesis
MTETPIRNRKTILVVVRWPIGGIRTYMRNMFRHFPQEYQLVLIAPTTHENDALENDVTEYHADLVLIQRVDIKALSRAVFRELKNRHFDLILSQGYISAVSAYLANMFFKIPHVLTIHGIVEPQLLIGPFGPIKRFFLNKMLSDITVLYAVSNDILAHLHDEFPSLKKNKRRSVVIPNGIEISEFSAPHVSSGKVRGHLGIPDEVFLFGFFGRFMPQKGFDLLIDAIDQLKSQYNNGSFAVLAVGSGDCLDRYKKTIAEKRLESHFYFLPFQAHVQSLYSEVNAIVMPSRWEASGLLAMETLCMGRPLRTALGYGKQLTILQPYHLLLKMYRSLSVLSIAV